MIFYIFRRFVRFPRQKTKKHLFRKRDAFEGKPSGIGYGFFVAAGAAFVFAGFIVLFALVAGLAAFALAAEFVGAAEFVFTGLATGAGVAVLTGAGVFAGLFAVLFAGASPQAMPRALNPRTVESTITLVILFRTPNLSQRIITCFQVPADRTQPFALNSFFFKANDNIEIENNLVNLKMKINVIFLIFFAGFGPNSPNAAFLLADKLFLDLESVQTIC